MTRVRELKLEPQIVVSGLVPPERVPGLMRAYAKGNVQLANAIGQRRAWAGEWTGTPTSG